MMVAMALLATSMDLYAQSIDLKQLTQKDQKIYLGVENPDSVDNFDDTAFKYMKELGRWRIVDNVGDADFVVILKGFNIKISGFPHFECYVKVFDNKMNFIYRGDFTFKSGMVGETFQTLFKRTINNVISTLPNCLSKGEISKMSIYYKATDKPKVLNESQELKFGENYVLALRAIKDGQNPKVIDYLSKCIDIDGSHEELYKQRAMIYLEMDKGVLALKDLGHYVKERPLDADIDVCWQIGRYQKSERDERIIRRSMVVMNAFNAANAAFIQLNDVFISNKTGENSANSVSQAYAENKYRMEKSNCSYCNGTGINPVAKSVASFGSLSQHWCDYCKKEVSDSHGYHDQCPKCNGKGFVLKR